ncbi:ankyrin repeat domain-containing protein [Marinobacter mobilis]|uniref:ankyrin repeat domain-containing protein n=1 Tax=Marinobacter mobilis TaxID=488533 RepID=UPI0035C76E78
MPAKGFALGFLTLALVTLGLASQSGCSSQPTPANLTPAAAAAADTPLMQAVGSGELAQVQALVEQGAALNTVTEQGTPLALAVTRSEREIAWYLLSRGASADLAGRDGVTPLMIAARAGDRRMVQMLLSAGAAVNAEARDGRTPVLVAARAGQLSVVKVLLAAGANVNVSQDGRSLLMHLVAAGDLLTAESVLAAGADVSYRSPDGTSALDLARASHNDDLQMLLLQAGAEF